MKKSWISVIVLAMSAPAAGQSNDAIALQGIAQEVRSLRDSVERGASLATRTQIALQRVVLQHQRVERLLRDLLDVRRQLDVASADREKALTTIRIMEGKMAEFPDPTPVRFSWEDTITRTKPDLERAQVVMQGCQARYNELGNSLLSEDAKLAALTSQLDEIERLLPLPAAGRH